MAKKPAWAVPMPGSAARRSPRRCDLLTPELKAMLDAGERDRFNAAIDLVPVNTKRVIGWRAKPFGNTVVLERESVIDDRKSAASEVRQAIAHDLKLLG